MGRNGYMLRGRLARRGYDWWWHSLVAVNKKTGELRPFFIEYFVINPALGSDTVIPGQLKENRKKGIRPSYSMVKAGAWGKKALQINNLYPIDSFSADPDRLNVRIGECTVTETHLCGNVSLSRSDAAAHPEYMSDAGEMRWDLSAEKVLSFNVGYGASQPFRFLNAFRMFWHAQGMFTKYKGTIELNGEKYQVIPDKSYGYQDKNWGSDYTNPWIWLSCNKFVSAKTGKALEMTSLDVGGGRPIVFGIPFRKKILIAFYYKGTFHEYNFSKFWRRGAQSFECTVGSREVTWSVSAYNSDTAIEINFSCPKNTMIRVNYENPDGEKNHDQLWNGGYASGTLNFFTKKNGEWVLEDELIGEYGGCEYGEY